MGHRGRSGRGRGVACTEDDRQRSFAVIYQPPGGGIWLLRSGRTDFVQSQQENGLRPRNAAFRKGMHHLRTFISGLGPRDPPEGLGCGGVEVNWSDLVRKRTAIP